MKIATATLALQSEHAYSLRQQSEESLRAWVGDRRPDLAGSAPPAASTIVALSPASTSGPPAASPQAAADDPRLLLLMLLIERLTGKPVKLFDAGQLRAAAPSTAAPSAAVPAANAAAARSAGYGIEYEYHASRQESEQSSFSAAGTVKTADGREIAFQLDLSMSRQASEQVDISFRAGDARRKDPLVINFAGSAAQLLDSRFRFDLNADGTTEEIPLLAGGSGYLALDRNGNGKIDSGAELFGPASGSGFRELAGYDQDGNGWIDESDAVFARLQVWQPGPDGQGSLTPLKAAGVGALYLGAVATPFELRGQGNSDLGGVRASSVFLTEEGRAGSLQEVDLTV